MRLNRLLPTLNNFKGQGLGLWNNLCTFTVLGQAAHRHNLPPSLPPTFPRVETIK